MPKAKSPPRSARAKASRPDLAPLDEHLAALLNPALNDRRKGFEEAPQGRFDVHEPRSGPLVRRDEAANARMPSGAAATADVLQKLLESGDPRIKAGSAWVPHRPARPEKSEGGLHFRLSSEYEPKGDQPTAIRELVEGIQGTERDQVLLGVTGSGKTYTMAQVIARTGRPALILAPNKTLAAQLYGEFKSFFPDNAVEYFVSYYDYYQPEAYVPRSDTYIEKESTINEQIDRMRHSATRSLLERDDVIIVASVSCIYGIGSVETYTAMTFSLKVGDRVDQRAVIADLVALQYKRTPDFTRGTFRVRGDTLELFPAHYEDRGWRIGFFGDEIESLVEFDPLTGKKVSDLSSVKIYANSHYVTPRPTLVQSIKAIKAELTHRLTELNGAGRLLEAQRLEQRTTFDLEMLEATGSCQGIENYSRYLTGRRPGEPPPTLFEYLPDNALVFTDESHVTVPQIGGMYRGDFRRKATLAEYGFRLPSCLDNRPLRFEEWDAMRPQTVHVSATPGTWEMDRTAGVFVEQVIRPTGLIDPPVEVRPVRTQVDDLLDEIKRVSAQGYRTLVTVLTKRMAEDLTEYLHENGVRVRYMHSDIDTIERIEIIRDLRLGVFDALVGINLLREGLDIPECALVAVLDADKEGFLRSETSLVQTIGRAARNVDGKVILYADSVTGSMERAMAETERRREKQLSLQRRARHHARHHQARHPGHPGLGLRGRPRHGGHGPRGARGPDGPQLQGHGGRPRKAHARGRRQPRIRGGRPPARRAEAPAAHRTHPRRRPHGPPGRGGSRGRRASRASANTAAAPTPRPAAAAAPPNAPTNPPTPTWARTISGAARPRRGRAGAEAGAGRDGAARGGRAGGGRGQAGKAGPGGEELEAAGAAVIFAMLSSEICA